MVHRSYVVDHPSKHLAEHQHQQNIPEYSLTQSMEDLKLRTVQRRLSFEETDTESVVNTNSTDNSVLLEQSKPTSQKPFSHMPVRLSQTSVVTTGNITSHKLSPVSSPVRAVNVSTHQPQSPPYIVQHTSLGGDIDNRTDDLHSYLSSLSEMPALQIHSLTKMDTSHLSRTDMHSYSYIESPIRVNDRKIDDNSDSPILYYGPNNYQNNYKPPLQEHYQSVTDCNKSPGRCHTSRHLDDLISFESGEHTTTNHNNVQGQFSI